MTSFICVMTSFFFLTLIVIERLAYGIKQDSIRNDLQYLWSHYDLTPDQIKWKDQ